MRLPVLIIVVVTFLVIAAICIRLNWRYEEFTLREKNVIKQYQNRFPGAHVSFIEDMMAESGKYGQHYGHGVYKVLYEADSAVIDFRQLPEKELKDLSDNIFHDFGAVMEHRELYYSFKVVYMTQRPIQKHPDGTVVIDTSDHTPERSFVYEIRK